MSLLRIYSEDGAFARLSFEELSGTQKNSFIGWKCYAGTLSLRIGKTGTVTSAQCHSIGIYGKTGTYGNIFRDLILETAPINCARRYCTTDFDLSIPKIRRPKYYDLLSSEGELVSEVGQARAIRGENFTQKTVVWDHSLFNVIDLSEWKKAAHCLEGFCKGEVVKFVLTDVKQITNEFLEWINFLTEKKGHEVVSEILSESAPQLYSKVLESSDLKIIARESNSELTEIINEVSTQLRQLAFRDIVRKVSLKVEAPTTERISLPESIVLEGIWPIFESIPSPASDLKVDQPIAEVQELPPKTYRLSSTGFKILCFIPMRNCSATIRKVIQDLSVPIRDSLDEILIIDNASTDDSEALAKEALSEIQDLKTSIRRNGQNLGFGGSHKLAFQYAVNNKFDYVLVVHGDGSGSPSDFLNVLKSGDFSQYDAILSSRLLPGKKRVGYPFYRFISNWFLNLIASLVTRSIISDFSGGPVNLYRVQSYINKFEAPLNSFDDRIAFGQDALLFGLYKRGLIKFVSVEYTEAGGKTFYSAFTQFSRSLIRILKYLVFGFKTSR
jgi:hypothetical protein